MEHTNEAGMLINSDLQNIWQIYELETKNISHCIIYVSAIVLKENFFPHYGCKTPPPGGPKYSKNIQEFSQMYWEKFAKLWERASLRSAKLKRIPEIKS